MKYVYQGPPYNTYRKGTKIKIDPQKYVYQGSPIIAIYKKKTRQNRPSEIGLSGVPHIIRIKSG